MKRHRSSQPPFLPLITVAFALAGAPAFAGNLDMPADSTGQKANFTTTVVQIDGVGGNRWYFGSTQKNFILGNVQTDTNGNGTLQPTIDGWVYPTSFRAIDMGSAAHGPAPGTAAAGTVLSLTSTSYKDPRTGISYGVVMYFVWQKLNSTHAGELCVSFSNDGVSWIRPRSVVPSGWSGAVPDCADPAEPIPVEAVAGFHRTANTIHLFYLNGVIPTVVGEWKPEGTALTGTETYLVTTSPTTPHIVSMVGEVTPKGVDMPLTGSGAAEHHAAFINLNAAYNPKTGAVYLTRAYAWPSTSGTAICGNGVCPNGVATLPNRGQLFCMDVGGAVWKTTASTTTWEKIFDQGRNASTDGWGDGWNISDPTCHTTSISHLDPLPAEDYENLDLVKTREGYIWDRPGLGSPYLEIQFVYGIQPNKKLSCNTFGTGGQVTQANRLATSGVVTLDCTGF